MIPDITYLILNYNPKGERVAQDVLNNTIDTFFSRKSQNISCEVFLLDQGTTPGHRRWIVDKQIEHGFSTILLEKNIGISGAINRVVRMSRSPVFALITSDVIVTKGMDEDLFEKVQVPEVFQVTPFTDKSDLDYQTWQPAEEFGVEHVDLDPLKKKSASLLNRIVSGGGSSYLRCVGSELNVMFWRRVIFTEEVGYFDERWKACYENIDYSLRCFLRGGCTAISRDSFVWHYHKMTHKNKSRELVYLSSDWQKELRCLWDQKWPDINKFIDIYKPLKRKNINDFKGLQERYEMNVYLSYDKAIWRGWRV